MRHADFPVDPEFTDRWSPRAYDPAQRLTEAELMALFEAARWAPSSSNEQPWKFYYSADAASRDGFNAFVNDMNRTWAPRASHLIIVCARKTFAASGKENPHAWYDTGAAVMSLVLQANKMGFKTRQMAGILRDVISEKLRIDTSSEDIICAVAIGKPGDTSLLHEKHLPQEKPNGRRPLSEFVVAV
jgi:nitroreductase